MAEAQLHPDPPTNIDAALYQSLHSVITLLNGGEAPPAFMTGVRNDSAYALDAANGLASSGGGGRIRGASGAALRVRNSTVEIDGNTAISGDLAATGGFSAATGTFSGGIAAGTGTFSSNVTIAGTLAVTLGTTLAALSATTGTFSGGISATTGTFSGAVSVASLTSAGAISGTTGTFSGAVSAASLTISGAVSFASLSLSGTLQVDGDTTLGNGDSDTTLVSGIFRTKNAAGSTTQIYSDAGNNRVILFGTSPMSGDTTPAAHVRGRLYVAPDSANDLALQLRRSVGSSVGWSIGVTSGSDLVFKDDADAEIMRIGDTASTWHVDVTGPLRASGNLSTGGNFTHTSSGGQVGFYAVGPVNQQSIGAAATDLTTVVALANNIRALLLTTGLGKV